MWIDHQIFEKVKRNTVMNEEKLVFIKTTFTSSLIYIFCDIIVYVRKLS